MGASRPARSVAVASAGYHTSGIWQIEEAARWWAEHRAAAPGLLGSDLRRAFALILRFPGAGALAEDVALEDVRRLPIGRSRYVLYYRVVGDVVEVLALWHSSRGEGPGLSSPV